MPPVKRSRTIAAPPEHVWRVIEDPFALPRWWPSLVRVEDASLEAWTKVLVTPRGKPVRADYTRVEADPPRRVVWRQELAESPFERIFSSAVTVIEVKPAGEDSARVTLTVDEKLRGRYRLGGYLVNRAARRRLAAALDGLERAVAPE